jgi:lyso-ornithine lipid O-acyltransferase
VSGHLLRLARILLYLGLTLSLMPVQAVAVAVESGLARRLPRAYHRWVCRILGIRLVLNGFPTAANPALYIVNHTSYLDIEILGAALEASFVSKAEVANWPWFGWLAKLQRTVFIDRQKGATIGHRNAIVRRLDRGDRLILFPEGTSSDGNHVLPFKSSLFSVAEYRRNGVAITVQPISVAYTRLNGIPVGRAYRPFFAWYGDMDMGTHLWHWLGLGVLTVEIAFHPPVTIDQFASRKELTRHCHAVVSAGVSQLLAGRKWAPSVTAVAAPSKTRREAPVRVA